MDLSSCNEVLTGPPDSCGLKEHPFDLNLFENGRGDMVVKLSEARMAARRAEEAGHRVDAIRNSKHIINNDSHHGASSRRQQAAQWLQTMVGNTSLPAAVTVEDLRVCLQNGDILCEVINIVQPGSVPKSEDPASSKQVDKFALPNYLYYDNIRNFLMAIEDMGLPVFEASALEKGPMSSNASAKLVDCILGLKSYHDWKQGGGLGFWRLKSPTDSAGSCASTPATYLSHSKNKSICPKNSRRKWIFSDQECLDCPSLSSSPEQSTNYSTSVQPNETALDTMRAGHSGRNNFDGQNEERASNPDASVSTTTWLKDIQHKFSEVLQFKALLIQETLTAVPIAKESYEGGATLSFDHNAPSRSLLSLITAIIGDKPAEEVPILVELMLRKIMEEFEHHLLTQRNQVAKMKCTLKDVMVREEKHVSHSVVLEALAAGTKGESKMEKNIVEEEEINNQKCIALQDSRQLLDNNKQQSDDLSIHLEGEKEEITLNYEEKVLTLQSQLTEASKTMQEMDDATSRMRTAITEKDAKWGKLLTKILKEFKHD